MKVNPHFIVFVIGLFMILFGVFGLTTAMIVTGVTMLLCSILT